MRVLNACKELPETADDDVLRASLFDIGGVSGALDHDRADPHCGDLLCATGHRRLSFSRLRQDGWRSL